MKRKDLFAIIAEVLEVDASEVTSDKELSSFEMYDSVNVLSLMVALDSKAKVRLSPTDVRDLRTIADIEAIAEKQGIKLVD